jgi:hypothetical protein
MTTYKPLRRQMFQRLADSAFFSRHSPIGVFPGRSFHISLWTRITAPAPSDPARFEATRWTVLLEAAQSCALRGPEALAWLCARFWRPLYTFARWRGQDPENAQDLVQGFFAHLIEHRTLWWVGSAKGRVRT